MPGLALRSRTKEEKVYRSTSYPLFSCAIRVLVATQAVVCVLLLSASFLGTRFHNGKWSRLSPRTHGQPVRELQKLAADNDLVQTILFQPSVEALERLEVLHVTSAEAYNEMTLSVLWSETEPLFMYIPTHEKEFKRSSLVTTAMVCNSLEENYTHLPIPKPTRVINRPSQEFAFLDSTNQTFDPTRAYRIDEQTGEVTELSSVLRVPHTRSIMDTDSQKGFGRRCVFWKRDGNEQMPVPLLFEKTHGLLAPNYPFYNQVQRFIHSIMAHLILIFVVWAHSLALPQPVSIVHAPRLGFYLCLGIWRILVLYMGKNALESIPIVQSLFKSIESRLTTNTLGDRFNSSDHIVLCGYIGLVVCTECGCMWLFRAGRAGKDKFDNPFKLQKRALYVVTALVMITIAVLMYVCVMTAAFHHSPLEIILGWMVSGIGLLLPFWFAIWWDLGSIVRFSFGLE